MFRIAIKPDAIAMLSMQSSGYVGTCISADIFSYCTNPRPYPIDQMLSCGQSLESYRTNKCEWSHSVHLQHTLRMIHRSLWTSATLPPLKPRSKLCGDLPAFFAARSTNFRVGDFLPFFQMSFSPHPHILACRQESLPKVRVLDGPPPRSSSICLPLHPAARV